MSPRFTGISPHFAPDTGRHLAISNNAVYGVDARTKIAPLRALALKTVSAA